MKKIALMLMAAIAVIACNPQEEIVPEIKVTTTDFTLPLAGTEDMSFKVQFTTNVAWTAALKEASEWCTITPSSGEAGDASVTVIALANPTKENRTAVLVLTAGTAVEEVTLTQLQTDAYELVESSATVGAEGGEYALKVMTNVDYTVVVPEDVNWVTVASTKAYAESTTTLNVAAFDELDATRSATLTVKAEGLEDLTFTLTQEGPKTKLWGIDMRTVIERKGTVKVGELDGGRVLSMALYDGKLVVCPGDGSDLVVLNKETGAKEGTLTIPGVTPYYVTNDNAGNLVVCNRNIYDTATYWWNADFKVYYLAPGSSTPVQLINGAKYGPIGTGLDVNGDVTKNALIAAVYESIPDITNAYQVEVWTVTDGIVGESVQVRPTNFIGAGYGEGNEWATGTWGAAPDNVAGFALLGTTLADGGLLSVYPENIVYKVNADATCTALSTTALPNDGDAWNYLPNKIETAEINGKLYVAMAMDIYSPDWSGAAWVAVFDAATMTPVVSCNVSTYAYDTVDGEVKYLTHSAGTADVEIEAVDGGMNVYYIANDSSAIEAFHYDL